MHQTIQNLIQIQEEIKEKIGTFKNETHNPNIIAVSKTFKIEYIKHLVDHGHRHFGENKVQEAYEKWFEIKGKNKMLNLHMIGKLQTNKVKIAFKIFDFIHSLDNIKLANKIAEEQKKYEKKIKLFIQVNLANEKQKSGISFEKVQELYEFCTEQGLNVIGLMCLPPYDEESGKYFSKLEKLNKYLNLKDLSMGMSHDYLTALEFNSTFLRIGSKIFGDRS